MKINKFTTALIAAGIVSAASAVHAANPVIYITGSTAARAFFFNAATTAGQIFQAGHPGTPSVVSPASTANTGANQVVFEGFINGTLVDIDATWTGSEAGIASVAGQPLQQSLNNSQLGLASRSYPLPGRAADVLHASQWLDDHRCVVRDSGRAFGA